MQSFAERTAAGIKSISRGGDHDRGIFQRRDGGDRRRGAPRSDTFGQAALCSPERAAEAVQQGLEEMAPIDTTPGGLGGRGRYWHPCQVLD